MSECEIDQSRFLDLLLQVGENAVLQDGQANELNPDPVGLALEIRNLRSRLEMFEGMVWARFQKLDVNRRYGPVGAQYG